MRQKRFIHRFAALTLAFLVFFTSTGFMVDAHFCQNKLKRLSLVGKAKTCQEVAECQKKCGIKAATSCHTTEDGHSKKGCCSNESTFVKFEGDFPITNLDVAPDFQHLITFLAFYNYVQLYLNTSLDSPSIVEIVYKTPVKAVDTYVLLQRFLC